MSKQTYGTILQNWVCPICSKGQMNPFPAGDCSHKKAPCADYLCDTCLESSVWECNKCGVIMEGELK